MGLCGSTAAVSGAGAAPRAPASPVEERRRVWELELAAKTAMRAGDWFCLLDAHWWDVWCEYTGFSRTDFDAAVSKPASGGNLPGGASASDAEKKRAEFAARYSIERVKPQRMPSRLSLEDVKEDEKEAADGGSAAGGVDGDEADAGAASPGSGERGKRARPGRIDNTTLLKNLSAAQMRALERSRKAARDVLVALQGAGAEEKLTEDGEQLVFNPAYPNAFHLRSKIGEDVDYVLVSRKVFLLLRSWYGGGPEIARRVIEVGPRRTPQVEVHPLHLVVLRPHRVGLTPREVMQEFVVHDQVEDHYASVSKTKDVRRASESARAAAAAAAAAAGPPLKKGKGAKSACEKINIMVSRTAPLQSVLLSLQLHARGVSDLASLKLWDFQQDQGLFAQLSKPDVRLEDVPLIEHQRLLLEEKAADGSWPLTAALTAHSEERRKALEAHTPTPTLRAGSGRALLAAAAAAAAAAAGEAKSDARAELKQQPAAAAQQTQPSQQQAQAQAQAQVQTQTQTQQREESASRADGKGAATQAKDAAAAKQPAQKVGAASEPKPTDPKQARGSDEAKKLEAEAVAAGGGGSGSGDLRRELALVSLSEFGDARGLTGLRNMGNTCFLNAAVQCLRHAFPIVHFFLSEQFKGEVNAKNPNGTRGLLAEEFAALLKALWGGTQFVTPKRLFMVLSKFAPRFAGYQQQDAQELLVFLLDGLHEDLNRGALGKPPGEKPLEDSLPRAVLAEKTWQRHLQRNDSLVVDWFQGQFLSQVKCAACGRESASFDPFAFLSLPLPPEEQREISVLLVRDSGAKPRVSYSLPVAARGTVLDLKGRLMEKCGVQPRNMVVANVYQNHVYKYFMNKDPVARIRESDEIVIFEVNRYETPSAVRAPQQQAAAPAVQYITVVMRRENTTEYFATPLLLSLQKTELRASELYLMILAKLYKFLAAPASAAEREKLAMAVGGSSQRKLLKLPPLPQLRERVDEGRFDRETVAALQQLLQEDVHPLFSIYQEGESEPLAVAPGGDRNAADPVLTLADSKHITLIWNARVHRLVFDAEAERECVVENKGAKGRGVVTLEECFKQFTKEEALSREDKWRCGGCKSVQAATKKIDLWRLPRVIIVHLKRFSYGRAHQREKLNQFVDFPLHNFDFGTFLRSEAPRGREPTTYNLFAVVNHYGHAGSGHYTALARHQVSGAWYEFDDESVTRVEVGQVKSAAAYLLCYERTDLAS